MGAVTSYYTSKVMFILGKSSLTLGEYYFTTLFFCAIIVLRRVGYELRKTFYTCRYCRICYDL